MTPETAPRLDRRSFLRTSATAVTSTAVVAAAPAAAQSSPFDGWFDDVSNYDGVADETGQSAVRITVGAAANGGAFGFGPAAVQVDPGTTVVWEWSGDGGSHNVEAEDGSFESELTSDAGHTFERTFDEEGVYEYFCMPHRAMGMKGAVVVGSLEGTGAASAAPPTSDAEYALVGVLAAAILALLASLPLSDARRRKRQHRAGRPPRT